MTIEKVTEFNQLELNKFVLSALEEIGYETPSPIQAQAIPLLLEGKDVLGMAQTGTGKTAAFALPMLSRIDLKQKDPQILVLTPTRELAIQVAEAFQKYASHMEGFHVLPIYGGQDYSPQIKKLKRGVHIVVGTPGRVMDHIRRKTLILNNLSTLVLDEADEMLRMGFIGDVEWILEHMPSKKQIALFSATMPKEIRKIATNYQNNPTEITIKAVTATADNIRQRFWPVSGVHKLDALTRILEAEAFDGMIIFGRTKNITVELSEKLSARGYSCEALNGDIKQSHREKIVERFKKGKIDIIVATDVAARGIDVARVSHVINYDVPYDTEAYVHRIGRTGRAGRSGDAILFVAPREKRMLSAIERATNKKIERMELPTTEAINDKRVIDFKNTITDTIMQEDLSIFTAMIGQYMRENPDMHPEEVAAAIAFQLQGNTPFFLENKPVKKNDSWDKIDDSKDKSRKKKKSRNFKSKNKKNFDRKVKDKSDKGYTPPKKRKKRA